MQNLDELLANAQESDSSTSLTDSKNPSEEIGSTGAEVQDEENNESASCMNAISVEIVGTSMEQANVVTKKSKKTQTIKAKRRSIGTQTYFDRQSTFFQTTAKPSHFELQQEVQAAETNIDVNIPQNIPDQTITRPESDEVFSSQNNDHTDSDDFTDDNTPLVEINNDSQDKDFNPASALTESDPSEDSDNEGKKHEQGCVDQVLSTSKPASEQIKIVVFEEAVVNAFKTCRRCGSQCTVYLERQIGSSCNIRVSCPAGSSHDFTWSTGPMANRMPIFHLFFASGILCNGLEPSKVLRYFESLKIISMSNVLKSYVIPAVFHVWKREQRSRLDAVEGKVLRVDSPGHSGLLGSGSIMDLERNVVLDTQVIKVNMN